MKLRDDSRAREHAEAMVKLLDIRCTGVDQKVGASRAATSKRCAWLGTDHGAQTTLGIGAHKRHRHRGQETHADHLLGSIARRSYGSGHFIRTSELRSICDRIAIISEGRVAAVLARRFRRRTALQWPAIRMRGWGDGVKALRGIGVPQLIVGGFFLISW